MESLLQSHIERVIARVAGRTGQLNVAQLREGSPRLIALLERCRLRSIVNGHAPQVDSRGSHVAGFERHVLRQLPLDTKGPLSDVGSRFTELLGQYESGYTRRQRKRLAEVQVGLDRVRALRPLHAERRVPR